MTCLLEIFLGEALLIAMLDIAQAGKHCGIVGKLSESGNRLRIFAVVRADHFVKQLRERGVGIAEPATVSDTVCHICEFIRVSLVEIVENGLLEYLGMKLRYAVYGMRADDAEICHSHLTRCHYRHA